MAMPETYLRRAAAAGGQYANDFSRDDTANDNTQTELPSCDRRALIGGQSLDPPRSECTTLGTPAGSTSRTDRCAAALYPGRRIQPAADGSRAEDVLDKLPTGARIALRLGQLAPRGQHPRKPSRADPPQTTTAHHRHGSVRWWKRADDHRASTPEDVARTPDATRPTTPPPAAPRHRSARCEHPPEPWRVSSKLAGWPDVNLV